MAEEKTHEDSWDAFLEAYSKLKEDNERLRDLLNVKLESSSNSESGDESKSRA